MKSSQPPEDQLFVAGIDIGSMTAKCILLKEYEIVSSVVIPTDADPRQSGKTVFKQALDAAGCATRHIGRIVGTGYGRVSLDIFDTTVTELTCHARGARFLNPAIEGLIDIGGQDSKAIRLNPDGVIADFAMNDRCAAGTGRFLEAMATALKIDLSAMGSAGLCAAAPCPINSTCVVFAESEVISLLAAGRTKADIAAGLLESIAKRVGTMAKRVGLSRNMAFVGGGAKNAGLKKALEKFLGSPFLSFPGDPQMTGALGAALIAREQCEAISAGLRLDKRTLTEEGGQGAQWN
jgi:(R)-2-hydroxyacyl-CoA dehydratese activating ATPase